MKKSQKLSVDWYLRVDDLTGRGVALLRHPSLASAVIAASGFVSDMSTYQKVYRDSCAQDGAFAGVYPAWPCGAFAGFTPRFVVVIHPVPDTGVSRTSKRPQRRRAGD